MEGGAGEILCWAAPKPWEANTEQVRDMLSQEPQGKDLLNQGTRWSALLKGDSQRKILFFFFPLILTLVKGELLLWNQSL